MWPFSSDENTDASSGASTSSFQKKSSGELIPEARDAAHKAYVAKFEELKENAEKNAYVFNEEAAQEQAIAASDAVYTAKAKELEPKLKLQKELKETERELAIAEGQTKSAQQEMTAAADAARTVDESFRRQLASGSITQEQYKQQIDYFNNALLEKRDKFFAADSKRREYELKIEKLEKELVKYDTDPRNIAWRKEKARKQRQRAAGSQKISKFRGTRTRLTDQAALIINFEQIAKQKHVVTEANKKKKTPKKELSRYDLRYKNFSLARLGTTGHYALTSLITKHSSMNVFFNKLPPQVLSLLIPSIKLYKVFYPKIVKELAEENRTGILKEMFDWRVPFDDVPVQYSDQTSQFAPENVKDILNGNGSLHAVGIKSFSYKYEGNNPATANTLLSADLKIYFENPEELIRKHSVVGPNKEPYTFQYSDLVNQASKKGTPKNKNAPNEHYYRIKIICGFTDVDETTIRNILSKRSRAVSNNGSTNVDNNDTSRYTQEQITSIIDAIKVSKACFYLSPYSYDLNFTETNSVELSIKYTAAVDAIMISEEADIFNSSDKSKELIDARKKFESFLATRKKAEDLTKNPNKEICIDEEERNLFEEFVKTPENAKLKNLEENLKFKIFNTKKDAYKNIYRRLIGLDNSTNPLAALYSVKIKTDLINALTVVGNNKERGEGIRKNQRVKEIKLINIKKASSIANFIDALKYQTAGRGKSNNPTMEEQAKKRIDQIHKQNLVNAGGGDSVIKFFFLGDILDAALECFDNIQSDYDRPRLVLGEIPILIPTAWDDKGTVTAHKTVFANLADIPISFDFFMQFFVDKIIKTQRERYTAMEFVKDIISSLVIPAASPSIFGIKESPNTRVKYSLLTFNANTVIKDSTKLDPLTNMPIEDRKTCIFYDISEFEQKKIDVGDDKQYYIDFSDGNKRQIVTTTAKDNRNNPSVLTYLYVYCSSKFPNKFKGNEAEDINYGVYHVRMGRDTGIVKKINFKKSEMPFQREFLARRAGSGKGTVIKQVYNADITLFGNNIYVPGDYIFIEPYYMSRSTGIVDLQESLGLGGYYMIIKVHNNISEASFETKLECIFQAPVSKNSEGKIEVDPIDEDACLKEDK